MASSFRAYQSPHGTVPLQQPPTLSKAHNPTLNPHTPLCMSPKTAFTSPAPVPLASGDRFSLSRSPARPSVRFRVRSPCKCVAIPPAPLHPSDHESISELAPAVVGRSELNGALAAACASAAPDAVVVVMFHARWCRVCKTLASKIPRLAASLPNVSWLRVDFAELENKHLCREIGVKLLPTFHVYKPGMTVDDKPLEDFTSGPFGVKRLEERLEPYR